VRIDVNPTQLNGYGLQLEDVRTAVAAQTANEAKGGFSGRPARWLISANDQLMKAATTGRSSSATATAPGAAVRRRQRHRLGPDRPVARAGQRQARRPAHHLPAARREHHLHGRRDQGGAAQLHAAINPAIELTIALDQTVTIRASVATSRDARLISILLVVLVVFVFLRESGRPDPERRRARVIIGTLGVMYLFGYSIDNLSLMALTISTGFVVDDAIVVLENITRHLEGAWRRWRRRSRGAAEIGSTVVSMSISLVAVFIPILLMGGIIGRLFREFAVVLSVTILVSLAVSLTATPDDVLAPPAHREGPREALPGERERGVQRILGVYERSLGWVLDHSCSS
jgi:multidrug efflux pump